ncbi:hypothetical protein H6B33_07580 [Gemmiger formicilis]|uniref:hypothetical protein n=1 Tax=Gemmiger formicilis TaxID=745368 RepID=UPI001956F5D4|nr:hypothetical protein [Gemmiger formicilis]MBM6915261.1 hypothetical protein [Gemmiger formicilis]
MSQVALCANKAAGQRPLSKEDCLAGNWLPHFIPASGLPQKKTNALVAGNKEAAQKL